MTSAQTVADPRGRVASSGTRRTLFALLACALGALPLKTLVSDSTWLVQSWLAMIVVLGPAAVLRLRRAPSALDIWPGIILLVPWLTRMYVPQHAWGGFLPSGLTFGDVSSLMDSLHRTTSDEVAPIHSTPAVRLVLAALLGLLAALVDLIAVVGRRGALAGVPLLVVYTVSGAVPRTPVAWFWFAAAAAGYLLLLGLDADDDLHEWGRRISRGDGRAGRQAVSFSAQRIGVLAVLVAVVVPFLVPDHPKNLIADAFHGGGGGVGSFGAGSGGGSISPFAALKGQLTRTTKIPLMRVHVDSPPTIQPFYARANILDKVTTAGWTVSGHGTTEPISGTSFGTDPPTNPPPTADYRAEITVTGLTGNAPVFAVPRSVDGLDQGTGWSSQDQILLGSGVHKGDQYTEDVSQPQPSVQQLQNSPPADPAQLRRWLTLPQIPRYVTDLVNQIDKGKSTPYARALAISNWFADPANGFVYSLKTTKGDSGSDLVDFLQHRTGYCQQYAAAMGIMLRLAGVPTRVVLGYMHAPPDRNGDFTITTFDAHAWVEAFFPGLGWIPFDPTPTAGLVGGKTTDLAWAPHVYSSGTNIAPSRSGSSTAPQRNTATASAAPSAAAHPAPGGRSYGSLMWTAIAVLALILLVLLPAFVRAMRRRRRYAAARRGDTDALWAELSDILVDLGYVWSPARSPRQVSAWLAADAGRSAGALDALAAAVEQRRYAPASGARDTGELSQGLRAVTEQLRARRSSRLRLRAKLWPASLGWQWRRH